MTRECVVDVKGLSKTYFTFRKHPGIAGTLRSLVRRESIAISAVTDVSFQIQRGEFVGLLGPNGAGKTTTLKMLSGLIRPTAGTAIAFGRFDTRMREHAYLRRIGMVMGQRNQLNPDLPATESLNLAAAIYDLDPQRAERHVASCAEMFGVTDKLAIPVRKLSLGERMKFELILAMVHEPELLFLDEPTIGLDFAAAQQIRTFLKRTSRELGLTVVLTSHYTRDIEELCERVILINHGTLRFDGALREIDPRLHGQKKIVVDLIDATSREFLCDAGNVGVTMNTIVREIEPKRICDIRTVERPLEEIFSELYSRPAMLAPT
jgi:ABC-2 type transport system ATP-binding protein